MNRKSRLLIFLSLLVTYLPFDARATHPMDKVGEVTTLMYNLDLAVGELLFQKNIIQYRRSTDSKTEDYRVQGGIHRKVELPRIAYYLDKNGPPLYELKEDGNLYYQDKVICRSNLIDHVYFSYQYFVTEGKTPEDFTMRSGDSNEILSACPDAVLLFGTMAADHLGKFRAINKDGEDFGLLIAADDFDGEWGRLDGVLENGDPLYFRFPDDEYQYLSVMLETQSATRFAREHFKNFDQLHREFREQLLDENSRLSQQFLRLFALGSLPVADETTTKGDSLSDPRWRLEISSYSRSSPALLDFNPDERSSLELWHKTARSALLAYLETMTPPEFFWAELNRKDSSYQYDFGFFIKEINVVVSLEMRHDSLSFNLWYTGPTFYHLGMYFDYHSIPEFITKYGKIRTYLEHQPDPYWEGQDYPGRTYILTRTYFRGTPIPIDKFVPPELPKKYLDVPAPDESKQAPTKD
jgi:hypothetical protein